MKRVLMVGFLMLTQSTSMPSRLSFYEGGQQLVVLDPKLDEESNKHSACTQWEDSVVKEEFVGFDVNSPVMVVMKQSLHEGCLHGWWMGSSWRQWYDTRDKRETK